MHRRFTLKTVLVLLTVVVGMAGAAVAAVAVGAQQVVFYACVNNSTGGVHMSTSSATCPGGSHKIHWNQQGPPGPQGPQGPRGPSNAFAASNDDVGNAGPFTLQTVDTLNLNAGSYAITAKVVPNESATPDDTLRCDLYAPDGSLLDQGFGAINNTSEGFTQDTLTMTSTLITSGGGVTVQCMDSQGVAGWYRDQIVAIQVATATPPAAQAHGHLAKVGRGTRP